MAENIIFALISVAISITLFVITKLIIQKKLKGLVGSQKILGIVCLAIVFAEVIYLGTTFGLFVFALEIITSIGVGVILIVITFQNSLKNWVAGIGIFFNTQINIGDVIEINGMKGTIIRLGLSKTVAVTEDGSKIFIPNMKFNEAVVIISHTK